jgi:ribonucleoside-diphosphate reductase alpha chain
MSYKYLPDHNKNRETDMTITVIKRNGEKEPLMIEKWQAQIAKVCAGIADVSQSMIEIKAQLHFYDNITTKEIDGITLRAIVDLIDAEQNPDVGHTNYQYVAGKQRLSMLRKDVYGSYTPPHLYEIIKTNVATGLYTPELLEWYSEDDWNKLNDMLDHEKDETYSYAAIEQLIEKYLVKNRATKETYETPQIRYMVAAATVFHKEEPNAARMRYIKEYYNAASDGLFTLATPVLAGLGTPTKQFSSCVLIRSDDDLDSIFASGEMMAKYASKRAGIGLEIGRLRSLGSPIRGGEIMHTGMIHSLRNGSVIYVHAHRAAFVMPVPRYFIPYGIISLMTLLFLRTIKAQKKLVYDTWTTELCCQLSSGDVLKTKNKLRFLILMMYLTYMKHSIKILLYLKSCMSSTKSRKVCVKRP